MPASQEQKVDFLLKKIGYSASKTGIAEDESTISTGSNTAKKPFEEGIASPLVIPSTSILSDSSFIPTTPPGSDTLYVKGYRTATALRMTRDSTVGTNTRSYIAYATYNDTSSARLTNWIDTQFGSSYIVKVFKGDPNSSGVELQQAGGNAGTDGWFFDYSSGVLNFNGVNLPSGITATNIYIVGYRYIGATGVQPPAGIGTFHDLIVHNNFSVSGVSTFQDDVNIGIGGTTAFFDISSGKVGIGIANPSQKIHIDGGNLLISNSTQSGSSAPQIRLNSSSSDGSSTRFMFGLATGSNHFINGSASNDSCFSAPSNMLFGVGNSRKFRIKTGDVLTDVDFIPSVDGGTSLGRSNARWSDLFTVDAIISGNLNVTGVSTFVGIITASAVGNVIPFLFNNYSDLPSASSYHGAFAHVHEYGKGYFAHAGNWMELVNKETTGIVGTGTERYDIGYLDATNLYVTGISTIGSIGISTGRITGPAITYIDPATVGDDTGTLVVKGNLQVEGTQTVVNSSTMTVTDVNIELAKGATNDAAADTGGITVKGGTDKTWQWLDATDSWTSSEHIRIPDDKVFGFATDTNTFIGRPAADTIAFTHGASEKVRITSDGYVGIGLTDPETYSLAPNLVVSNLTSDCGITIIGQSSNSTHSRIAFGRSNFGTGQATAYIQKNHANTGAWQFITQTSGTDIQFRSAGDIILRPSSGGETNYHEHFTFKNSGDVGIGSATPTAKLDVVGNTILQGNLNVTGISTFNSNVNLPDNTRVLWGNATNGDFGIYHDTDHSYLHRIPGGTGDIYVKLGGDDAIVAKTDSSVELYWDNFKKLETLQKGVGIAGSIHIDNDAYVTGITTSARLNVTGVTTVATLNVGVSGQTLVGITTILDEDNMASNSATALATQQSIKAYVDGGASPASSLAVSADSGSNESINLVTEVLDIEGTANEIETATGTNKVVIGLPNNVTIGNKLTVTGDVGIGASLNVTGITTFANTTQSTSTTTGAVQIAGGVGIQKNLNVAGVSTFQDDVTINKDKMLIFDRFGEEKTRIRWNDTLVVTQIRNTNDNLEIGYRPTHLMWLEDRVLGTKLGGVNITGDTETDTLSVGGTATFTGTISAGSTTGTDGYYLKTTGIGVTWAAFPSSRTGLTTAATAGQSSFNFSYNVGYVDVFVNGVKLPSSEFTASNGSTIILDDAAFENDTIEFVSYNTVPNSSAGAQNLDGLADVTITGTPVRGETLQHNGSVFVNDYTPFTTTTSTSETLISGVPAATYRSVEYTVQATRGTNYHVTKLLAIHDGTNVTFNEYGTLFTNTSLASFSFDISSGSIRLLATPTSSSATVFKMKFTGIKV